MMEPQTSKINLTFRFVVCGIYCKLRGVYLEVPISVWYSDILQYRRQRHYGIPIYQSIDDNGTMVYRFIRVLTTMPLWYTDISSIDDNDNMVYRYALIQATSLPTFGGNYAFDIYAKSHHQGTGNNAWPNFTFYGS